MAKKMRVLELFPFKCYCAGKFYVKILSSGVEPQKERSGAPQGPIQGAPRGSKRLKTGKNDQNLSIFYNFLPSLTMKSLVICLASFISAAELDKKAEDP